MRNNVLERLTFHCSTHIARKTRKRVVLVLRFLFDHELSCDTQCGQMLREVLNSQTLLLVNSLTPAEEKIDTFFTHLPSGSLANRLNILLRKVILEARNVSFSSSTAITRFLTAENVSNIVHLSSDTARRNPNMARSSSKASVPRWKQPQNT